jgi:hypothetical protein
MRESRIKSEVQNLKAAGCSRSGWRAVGILFLLAMALLIGGCATRREQETFTRTFEFGRDTFAYSNQLFWVYKIDPATGKATHEWREPPPTYAQHCFVVARSARQFFQHAEFDGSLPRTDEPTYRRLIRRVISLDPRHELASTNKVTIPGFSSLHEFSASYEDLLKAECGSMWKSYFQRGHWRMIWFFTSGQQRRMAQQLIESIKRNRPPVVHMAHFPRLQINHALLFYDAQPSADGWEFAAYDPNFSTTPSKVFFREKDGRFYFPPQSYFPGGKVDVYEIYYRWNY